jgi:hypothetical protein
LVLVGVGTAGDAGSKACDIGGRVKNVFAEDKGVGADARCVGCTGSGGGARVLCASIGG